MALPYWVEDDLLARVGVDAMLAVLDRNNDGVADSNAHERLQKDCDARVEVALGIGGYPIETIRELKPEPVIMASLDAAVVYVWKHCPEHLRKDWAELDDRLATLLEKFEEGAVDLALPPSDTPVESGMSAVSDVTRGW